MTRNSGSSSLSAAKTAPAVPRGSPSSIKRTEIGRSTPIQPFANRIGPVVHHHDRVGETVRAQKFELMQKQRLAAHVDERLG